VSVDSSTERAYGPTTPEDVARLRKVYPVETAGRTDEYLAQVIEGAKDWIGQIKWSWTVVASSHLRTGRYSQNG